MCEVNCEDLSFVERNDKLNEEMLFYNQSIKEAQGEIKLKTMYWKKLTEKNIREKRFIKIHQNEEGMKYNFVKRKSKFISKDALSKKN